MTNKRRAQLEGPATGPREWGGRLISPRDNQPQGCRAGGSSRGQRHMPGEGGTNGAGRGPFVDPADEDPGLLALLLRNNAARAQAVDRQIWDQLAEADGWGPGSFFLNLPGNPDRVCGHPDALPWRCCGVHVVFPSHLDVFVLNDCCCMHRERDAVLFALSWEGKQAFIQGGNRPH